MYKIQAKLVLYRLALFLHVRIPEIALRSAQVELIREILRSGIFGLNLY